MRIYAEAGLGEENLSHDEYELRKYNAQMKASKIAYDYWYTHHIKINMEQIQRPENVKSMITEIL